MKTLVTSLALLIATGLCAQAQTMYEYPADDPVLEITFPEPWEVSLTIDDEDYEVLTAKSPDEAIEIELWPLDEYQVKKDPEAAVMEAVEEVNEIIEDYVEDFEVVAREEMTINGIYVAEVRGEGVDVDTGDDLYVSVDIMTPNDETVFIMMYWGEPGAEKTHINDLTSFLKSLKKH